MGNSVVLYHTGFITTCSHYDDNVCLAQWICVLITATVISLDLIEVSSISGRFQVLEIRSQSADFNGHTFTARLWHCCQCSHTHSNTVQTPQCFIIYRTWRPGCSHLRWERIRGLLGYCQPWPLRQTAQTFLSWSPRHRCRWLLFLLILRWRRRMARVCTKVDGPLGSNLQVVLCVTDELLTHHWGAAFPIMMRSRFPISTYHKPTRQKQCHKSRRWETIQ